MTFEDAQHNLLAQVRDRIRNGELTERGLARLIGISQPHAHNVLKGIRKLSPQISDSILKSFHLSLLDLVPLKELEAYLQRQTQLPTAEVPFLDSPVGPGMPWPAAKNRRKRFPLPFASALTAPEFVVANLISDPEMPATLVDSDIALFDTSETMRANLAPEGLYAVNRGPDTVLRYVRPGRHVYFLASDRTLNLPIEWERLRFSRRDLIDRIRARVRWLGREHDRILRGPQRGRFLYDATS